MSNYRQYVVNSGGVILPEVYTSPLLAVSVKTRFPKSSWHVSAYLQTIVSIGGIDFSGQWFPLVYGYQLIEIPYAKYKLRYRPESNSKNLLQIRPLSKSQINQLMPLYTVGQPVAEQPVLDSVPTSFTAVGYVAANPATTYLALAANPARQTYAIVNLGTVAVHVDLDPPTSSTKRLVAIPANGTYVSDIPYIGNVYAWSSNATACPIEVREFIQ